MIKVCSKCKIEKDVSEFNKNKNRKDGLNACCKECSKKYSAKWYEKNKDKVLKQQKKYQKENKEKVKEYNKRYREKNKVSERERQKLWYEKNKEYKKDRNNKNRKLHLKLDLCFRLHKNFSCAIWRSLKIKGYSKQGSSILQYLPYTMQQLKEHLEKQFEPWMNWKNYGSLRNDGIRRWNIDHVIPQSKLPYDSMEHENFKICWALSNLRPLEALENTKKGAKIL